MKAWLKRMKPKIKNWRWWMLLPLILLCAIVVLTPIKLMQWLGLLLTSIGDAMYDNFDNSQTWISSLIKWSERGDKN